MSAEKQSCFEFQVSRSTAGGISTGRQAFPVMLEERMTVLDALFLILREQDSSLSFRCACRVGMCGTCAVEVNGVPRLACKTRVCSLQSGVIVVRPLPHLPVVKDLVVSLEPFFAQWKQIKPALRPKNPDSSELARIPADSAYARHSKYKTDCITCGACYAACGVKGTSSEYLGPAAINRAFLRMIDPRDTAQEERKQILNSERAGVWRCHTQYNCTIVCPKRISLTDTINQIRRMILFRQAWESKS